MTDDSTLKKLLNEASTLMVDVMRQKIRSYCYPGFDAKKRLEYFERVTNMSPVYAQHIIPCISMNLEEYHPVPGTSISGKMREMLESLRLFNHPDVPLLYRITTTAEQDYADNTLTGQQAQFLSAYMFDVLACAHEDQLRESSPELSEQIDTNEEFWRIVHE